jgi:hypothetical protein
LGRFSKIFSKSKLFRYGGSKIRQSLVVTIDGIKQEVKQEEKRSSRWLAIAVLLTIVIGQSFYLNDFSKASSQSSITKTSSADWGKGTNSGLTTTSDELKISATSGWADENYGFRKQATVTAQASNTITKGHTLNLAGTGSGTFDGSGDYFDAGDSLNSTTLPVTIEAWVKITGAAPNGNGWAIFASDDGSAASNYAGFWMYIDQNRNVFLSYGSNGTSISTNRRSKLSASTVSLDTWTHVTGVIRGATDMSIYLNGVDAGGAYSGTGGAMAHNTDKAKIGIRNVAVSPAMRGNIDEVRIWSKERTTNDITADMYKEIAAQANLEAYYKFNQSSGTLADSSGHSLTATATGNATYSPYSNVWGGIDTKSLIDAGKLQADGDDLRLFYGANEIERELIPATGKTLATSEATQVLFKAQAQVTGGATDDNYYLYYGNSNATDPVANVYEKKMRVKNAYIKPSDGAGTNSLQYNADNFPTGGDGTMEFWYKWSNQASKAWAGPIFSGTDSNDKWMLFYDRSAYRLRVIAGGNQYNPTGSHNNTGDWNHIVVTWHNTDTNAQIRVYENNALTQSDDAAAKITSWPNYLKFTDPLAGFDGIELGHFGIYNTAKDSTWVSNQYSRTTAVPFASGRDASATFIHNYDGSGLDATEANGGYASGTATATASNVVIGGDYRLGDTNDERANNSWVSGVYYWYDDFSGTGTKPVSWREVGKINTNSDAVVLGNDQHLLMNKNNIPSSIRVEAEAKGTGPKFTFNDTGAYNTSYCGDQMPGDGYPGDGIWWPRNAPNTFINSVNSSFILQKRDYITNGNKIYIDIVTPGNYSGLTYQYWNGTSWVGFTPTDTTAGFTKSGYIDFSSIYASLSGANPPTVGTCNFTGQTYNRFIKITATGVTTAATYNIIYNQSDFAENFFSNVANTLAGDLHSATGNTTIARDTTAYKKIAMSKTSTTITSYMEGWQTFSSTASGGAWDTSAIGISSTTDATFDSFKAYKALANEPSTAAASEVPKYGSGAYYSSPTSTAADSGIINLGWIGGWGTPNGFSANVTVPSNTSIEFKVRSSAVGGSNDADWTDWATIGTANSTGEYTVQNASMPNITLGMNKYLQIKATFNTTDGLNTPTLQDYSVFYIADTDAPTNPSVSSLTINGTSISDQSWTNVSGALLATFGGSTDPENQSGVAGYYIYLGTSSTADPVVSGAYQSHVGAPGDSQTFNSSINSGDDGKYYYLIVKSKDGAGNVSSAATLYRFGYDETIPTKPSFVSVDPTGYTTTNSFDFTWPVGTDPSGANGASGIKYYEYRRGNEGVWSHTLDENQRSVSSLTAYQEGANVFYVRTVDEANNISSNYSQVTYYWSGTAPPKPDNLAISPGASDENNFAISWDKPSVEEGNPPVTGYYYSINAAPTAQNVTYIASTSSHVALPEGHYATKQGVNTFYVVAVNEAGRYSLEEAYIASADFTCQTVAPPIPVSVSISDTTNRAYSIYSLTTKWSAGISQDSNSFGHYVIQRSTNGTDFTELATTTSTAYIDASNLNNSTKYYYRILAVDNAGSTSAVSTIVSKTPTGKYQTPPSYLSKPQTSDVKSSSARVSWTTDRASNSIVKYGKTQTSLSASSGQLDSVLNHVVNLLGLEPSTTYYYQAQSLDNERDYATEEASSELQSFTTLASPAISNVNVSNISLSSADVTWETTTLAVSSLNYGNNSNLDKKLDDVSGSNTTKHSVKISDLSHSTRYSFRISGTDADNNELTSDLYYFETLPMPKVENLKLDLVKDQSRPKVKVSWNTNVATSSIVKYSGGDESPREEAKAKLVTEHEVMIENLSDETNYKISVSGMDSIGNLTAETSSTILTPQDSRPPQISDIAIETSNVGLNRQDKAQVVVSWKTDEPASSRVEYGVGLSGDNFEKQTSEDVNLSTNHVVIISDLEPTSPYHLKVTSKDKAGNLTKSDDQAVVSSEVPKSVLRVLLNALESTFGWIKI